MSESLAKRSQEELTGFSLVIANSEEPKSHRRLGKNISKLNLFKKVVDPKIGFSQSRLLHCKIWLFKAKILSFVASSFISVMQTFLRKHHWVKGVHIWSFYGPYFLYSVRMRKNTDQKTTNMDTFHAVHSTRARKKLK